MTAVDGLFSSLACWVLRLARGGHVTRTRAVVCSRRMVKRMREGVSSGGLEETMRHSVEQRGI